MILLDTHAWVRWLLPTEPLSASLTARIENTDEVAVSAISCWEVTMLTTRQRLTLPLTTTEWIREATQGSGITVVPVSCDIAHLAAELPQHHRDPADRLIIATALYEDASLISLDEQFPAYFFYWQGAAKLIQS